MVTCMVSEDYQDALIQDTTDDTVVASVGYVRQGAFKPGMRGICRERR